jgi:hypothetical protein
MNGRYHSWAGLSHFKYLEVMSQVLDGKTVDIDLPYESYWPIVDSETCGEIKGYPTPAQTFAIAFTPAAQSLIVRALNHVDQIHKKAQEIDEKLKKEVEEAGIKNNQQYH